MIRQAILAFLLVASAGLGAADVAATLIKVSGKGRVLLPGGVSGEFRSGTLLRPGSRISTEEASLAVLLMGDGSRVNLGPNTDLQLSVSSQEGELRNTVFELFRGLFRATVQKLTVGSAFQVKTSDAVAAVKGTDFEVEVDEGGTEARVKEGTVWLEDANGERAVLKERMAARAQRAGHLAEPRQLSPQELERFGQWARESVSPHSGEYGAIDRARQEAWAKLRPDQRAKVAHDLAASLGDAWSDITTLRAEERQQRWNDRLRNNDERHLAQEGAKVDFALGKTALDRQGRRVRFDEFLLRPAADQVQYLNYTRRDDRTDLLSSINTYNRNLPALLSEAPGMNQRVWRQGLLTPPTYWVVDSALVAANSSNDSLAINNSFYDPYFRTLAGFWELPVRDVEIRLNIPDLQQPRAGGVLVEQWVRTSTATLPGAVSVPDAAAAYDVLHHVPGGSRPLSDINATNMVWTLGDSTTLPTTVLLNNADLEAQPGDLAFGFRRTYHSAGVVGLDLEFRNYVIDENGEVVNLAGVSPDKLMEVFVSRGLIASLKQLELRSNTFMQGDGINVVSKLLFLFDISKSQDQL